MDRSLPNSGDNARLIAAVRAGNRQALDELLGTYPQLPRAEWLRLVEAARTERAHPGGRSAQRELFRRLRQLLEP